MARKHFAVRMAQHLRDKEAAKQVGSVLRFGKGALSNLQDFTEYVYPYTRVCDESRGFCSYPTDVSKAD